MRFRFLSAHRTIFAVSRGPCKLYLAHPAFGGLCLAAAWSLALAGCAAKLEPVRLELAGTRPSADVSDLAAVLAGAVTEDGRARPAEVEALGGRLDSQIRRMALAGPTATPDLYPDERARWAYWYNARVAWSMKLASLAGFPEDVRLRTMLQRPFLLDGRVMSLARIDEALLAEASRTGDFRLAACVPGVCLSYAPLPNEPYDAEGLEARLEPAINALVLDQRRFVLDVERKQVRAPSMLWACRGMILRAYEQKYGHCRADLITALRARLGLRARRRLAEALGYAVVPPGPGCGLAVPKRRIYFPGKIGRIEP